jgi:hypothetical protein
MALPLDLHLAFQVGVALFEVGHVLLPGRRMTAAECISPIYLQSSSGSSGMKASRALWRICSTVTTRLASSIA